MRIAIISDIHGNGVALEAVLNDLSHERIDQLVCLGDAVQGGPQPAEVVKRLRELACPVVKGNADAWLLTGADSGAEQITAARRKQMDDVRRWQLSQLTIADQEFMRAFQPTVEIPLPDELRLVCYHGSPQSFDHVILPQTPEDEVRQYLTPQPDRLYTGGHTHLQFIRHFGRTFHFNPGSVGFAYRHDQSEEDFCADPWAEYAVLTHAAGRLSLEFRRSPFDVAALIAAYQDSGRPHADLAIAQYAADRSTL